LAQLARLEPVAVNEPVGLTNEAGPALLVDDSELFHVSVTHAG
jgi:hypothetical protein